MFSSHFSLVKNICTCGSRGRFSFVVLVRRSHPERTVRRTARTTTRREQRLSLARMRQVNANPTKDDDDLTVISLDGSATRKTTTSTWNVGKVCLSLSLSLDVSSRSIASLSISPAHRLLELPQFTGITSRPAVWCVARRPTERERGKTNRDFALGIVLLDLDEQKLECIYEAIINDAIANGQMNKDVKDELLRLLTSSHMYAWHRCFRSLFALPSLRRHPDGRSSRRRSSTMDFLPLGTRRASLAGRRKESISDENARRMSLLETRGNGEPTRTLKNIMITVRRRLILSLPRLSRSSTTASTRPWSAVCMTRNIH